MSPAWSVVPEAHDREPLPDTTVNVTGTPDTGLPLASVAIAVRVAESTASTLGVEKSERRRQSVLAVYCRKRKILRLRRKPSE